MSIAIYTDGACKGNPGVGGWSFVVVNQLEIVDVGSIDIQTRDVRVNSAISKWKLKSIQDAISLEALVECHKILNVDFGFSEKSTNNRMEITAILGALRYFERNGIGSPIIFSDSAYCVNAISMGWIENWIENGWKTSSGSPVKNDDLLKQVWELCKDKEVQISHVRGHSGNILNDLADKIADKASSLFQKQQFDCHG